MRAWVGGWVYMRVCMRVYTDLFVFVFAVIREAGRLPDSALRRRVKYTDMCIYIDRCVEMCVYACVYADLFLLFFSFLFAVLREAGRLPDSALRLNLLSHPYHQ